MRLVRVDEHLTVLRVMRESMTRVNSSGVKRGRLIRTLRFLGCLEALQTLTGFQIRVQTLVKVLTYAIFMHILTAHAHRERDLSTNANIDLISSMTLVVYRCVLRYLLQLHLLFDLHLFHLRS